MQRPSKSPLAATTAALLGAMVVLGHGLGLFVWSATTAAAAPAAGPMAPGFVLQPGQGAPFSTVAFTGSNFCHDAGCGPVSITFANQIVAAGVGVAADGSIKGQIEVPPTPAGSQRVVASQPGADISVTALFFVTPNTPVTTGGPSATTGPSTSEAPRPTVAPGVIQSPTTTPRQTATSQSTTSTASPPPTTSASSTTDSSRPASSRSPVAGHHGRDWWPWLVVAAVVVLLAAGVGVRRVTAGRSGSQTGRGQ